MEIVGGGKVHVYDAVDEGPHASGSQELWQESWILLWWDLKQEIGGFYRIGHETNHATGLMIALWNKTFSPQGHFKKTTHLPLRDQDRLPSGFGSGEGIVRYTHDGSLAGSFATTTSSTQNMLTSSPTSSAMR